MSCCSVLTEFTFLIHLHNRFLIKFIEEKNLFHSILVKNCVDRITEKCFAPNGISRTLRFTTKTIRKTNSNCWLRERTLARCSTYHRSEGQSNDVSSVWLRRFILRIIQVIAEYRLATSKRLSLAEQAWYALATHFTIYLTDKDTIDLTEVQRAANNWREIIETFDNDQEQREFDTKKSLERLFKSIENFRITFRQNHL